MKPDGSRLSIGQSDICLQLYGRNYSVFRMSTLELEKCYCSCWDRQCTYVYIAI